MVFAASCGCIVAQPIDPRAPASQTAAASPTVANPAIGAWTMGCSIWKRSIRRRSGHIAPSYQRPAEAPPSTCKISPVTNVAFSRIHHGVDHILRLADTAQGLQTISDECIGVRITPGETSGTPSLFGQITKLRLNGGHWAQSQARGSFN